MDFFKLLTLYCQYQRQIQCATCVEESSINQEKSIVSPPEYLFNKIKGLWLKFQFSNGLKFAGLVKTKHYFKLFPFSYVSQLSTLIVIFSDQRLRELIVHSNCNQLSMAYRYYKIYYFRFSLGVKILLNDKKKTMKLEKSKNFICSLIMQF